MPEARELSNYINGEFRPSSNGKTIDVVNPATEDVIAQVPASIKRICRRSSIHSPAARR